MSKWLSVVVIGRNEGKYLGRLFESLKFFSPETTELIYVDSASTDNSLYIAKDYGCTTVELSFSKCLSASAARNIGTTIAEGTWVLYLDGDMELEPEFISWLNNSFVLIDKPMIAGYLGNYRFIDEVRGITRNNALGLNPGVTTHFGGAILLRRDVVVSAGNWSDDVFANEEIELYARIQKLGYMVYFLDIPMIVHYTQIQGNIFILYDLFIPRFGNKKYFGIGQAVLSAFRSKSLKNLIKAFPFPFVFLGTDILSLFLMFYFPHLAVLVVLILFQIILIAMVRVPKRFALYHGLALRMPFGIFKNIFLKKELCNFRNYLNSLAK